MCLIWETQIDQDFTTLCDPKHKCKTITARIGTNNSSKSNTNKKSELMLMRRATA